MLDIVVEKIREMSQVQGLKDGEIATRLGCSRATVNRARSEHGIERANLGNRLDKTYECARCHTAITVARKERKQKYGPCCRDAVAQEQVEVRKAKYLAKKNGAA